MSGEGISIKAHKGIINDVAFSPDGNFAITAGEDLLVNIWDLNSFTKIFSFQASGDQIVSIAVVQTSENIIVYLYDKGGYNFQFNLMEPHTIERISDCDAMSMPLTLSCIPPFLGRGLLPSNIILSDNFDNLCLFEMEGKLIKKFDDIFINGLKKYKFSANGERFITYDYLHVDVWNSKDGKLINYTGLKDLNNYGRNTVNLSLPKDLLDEQIELMYSANMAASVSNKGPSCVDISPDGRRVITGQFSTNDVVLWEVNTGIEIKHFKGHKKSVPSVSFSPDGKTALSGDLEGFIYLWKLPE